jgi:hypothetical protein
MIPNELKNHEPVSDTRTIPGMPLADGIPGIIKLANGLFTST